MSNSNPFTRKQLEQPMVPAAVFSFMLMCAVVTTSFLYIPHSKEAIFTYIEEANAALEVANGAIFGTYMQLASVAAAVIVPVQTHSVPAPSIDLTATYISSQEQGNGQ